jgi:hypothetical protein
MRRKTRQVLLDAGNKVDTADTAFGERGLV